MIKSSVSRRQFVSTAAASALAFNYIPKRVWGANETLYVAGIGVGGKGAGEVNDVTKAGGKFVALCDVDTNRAGGTFKKYADAKVYTDFRKLLEKEKGIDAVTVSTPDHMHAPASVLAMSLGKHVYCQKPLTHSVYEARVMTQAAKYFKVQTQMGNQAHAGEPIRRAVELLRAGIIGEVTEVHAWTNRPIWPQGQKAHDEREKTKGQKPPASLDWDQWIGPAPMRPYNPCYLPFKWRGWWDFGTGALGDMACHIMDMAYWALDLGFAESVEAESGGMTSEAGPDWSTIEYQFAAREKVGGGELGGAVGPRAAVAQPAVKYMWYDGRKDGKQNAPYELLARATAEVEDAPQDKKDKKRRKAGNIGDPRRWDMVVVGDKGLMLFNRSSTNWVITPGDRAAEFNKVPKTIRRVPNEDVEWVAACKGGPKAASSFDYSGPFTEMVLMGNLAVRLGKKIDWDAGALKAKGAPEADPLINREYREGWTLPAPKSLL